MSEKRKAISNRHKEIITLIKTSGFATVEEMSKLFNVTPQTIRRDINFLDEEGHVSRYHGGAGLAVTTENVEYGQRKTLLLTEKQKIAKAAAQRIDNHASLFINIGTTTECVAGELSGHKRLRIITNNLNVAAITCKNEDFEVMVTGGIVRSRDCGITGEATVQFIRQFKVDIGIIGISGIDQDGTLLDFDFREVHVARTIMDNARKVFLVTDHTKFGRNAMVKLGNISEVHTLITDKTPPKNLLEIIRANNINLVIA